MLLCAVLAAAAPAAAQQVRATAAAATFHKDPQGTELGTVPKGARVRVGTARGDWIEVTLEGFIYSPSVTETDREGFDLAVAPRGGENLRREPNGTVVARLVEGALLTRVGVRGGWTQVKRTGWVRRAAFGAPAPAAAARVPDDSASAAAAPDSAAAETAAGETNVVEVATGARLYSVPDGGAFGTLDGGARGRVVSRSGEWVRVQVDGWVKATDLTPAAEGVLVGVSAAEVRAAPDRFVGKVVEWRLQVIAVQRADELRPEMPAGQPYLLTRGPLPEPGFVYVTVTKEQAAEFAALPPLQEVTVRAVVRAARTRYLATPVVEFLARIDPAAR